MNSRIARILFVISVIFAYGLISYLCYSIYNRHIGKSDFGLSEITNPIVLFISMPIVFYVYFTISFFNQASIVIFFTWTRLIRPASFARFLVVGLAGLLAAYLLGFLIFPFTKDWAFLFVYDNKPRWFGDTESGNFIGNIIIGTLLSWSWFLPLWYYKLGDWFWGRGKYAKNE